MNTQELKKWIDNNLFTSTLPKKLISKRCVERWFSKTNNTSVWKDICSQTSFLDNSPGVIFPQRIWHIINDRGVVKCINPTCQNIPRFNTLIKGYFESCCCKCAQTNPVVVDRIKKSNRKKYGVDYGLSSPDIIKKRKETLVKKYGVENVSKLSWISEKKKETCMKNFGTEWFLERQDLKEEIIKDKYGVSNVQQVPEIRIKRDITVKKQFYDNKIQNNYKFINKVTPAFTLEDYLEDHKKYPFQCNLCKTTFDYEIRWDRCPRCNVCYPSCNTSIFEIAVRDYVKTLVGEDNVEENNRKALISGKELDVYIPSRKLAIECNGLYWHGENVGCKNKNYHLSKLIECERAGIRLIHIFEDEWETKQEIVKSKLDRLLNKPGIPRVYARKCKIREIRSNEKKLFLNENHVQGNDNAGINLGLWFTGQLVAVMTFANKRAFIHYAEKDKGKDEYELSRYAALRNISVVGGASKLLAYFIREYQPAKIISYADRRWSNGNLYEKLGFTKINDGIPNYWYFGQRENYKRFHRFGFAKHTLAKKLKHFDPNISEWENMKNHYWDRIWDCGSFKFEMTI